MMELVRRLDGHSADIVNEALAAVQRAHLQHYEESGEAATRARLHALYDLLVLSLRDRNLVPMLAHAEKVAQERFKGGFGLGEVQTAFNVLEEALWKFIVRELPPEELADGLGQVGTVLGAGKDKLARTYVSLATHAQVPTLNMEALFKGAGV